MNHEKSSIIIVKVEDKEKREDILIGNYHTSNTNNEEKWN